MIVFVGTGVVPNIGGDIERIGSLKDVEANNISGESHATFDRNIIYVDDDNTEGPWDGTIEHPYRYIQDGIDAADPSDTVFVFNGTYYENVIINKAINIVGEDKESTIIDGNKNGNVVVSYADWVNTSGFTIQNSGNDVYNVGIHISANYNAISECIVRNNRNGISLVKSFYSIISETIVTNNTIGIWLDVLSAYNDIVNCEIYNNSDKGIFFLEFCEKSNITNCSIYDNDDGILFIGSINCNIVNCTIYDNDRYGLFLLYSENCRLRENIIYDNSYNFCVESQIIDFYHDIDTSNTINGKPMVYLVEQSNITVDESSNAGYVGLVSCTNITVKNLDVWGIVLSNTIFSTISNVISHDSRYGIHFSPSSNNIIKNCYLYNNYAGIYFGSNNNDSSNNEISDNTIANNKKGIYLSRYSSNDNIISNNTIISNIDEGIHLETSSNNNIVGNTITNNNKGISLTDYHHYFLGSFDGSCENTITENMIADNNYSVYVGIMHPEHDPSDNNHIYHNNFINNSHGARDECSNFWDNGYSDLFDPQTDGGNYWDDHDDYDSYNGPNQDICGSDGIVDQGLPFGGLNPYIDNGVNDNYPFKNPYGWLYRPGDLDYDGDVDAADLAQLLGHYGMTSGATYEDGDIDGDGDVDLSDLAVLLGNYGYPD